MDVGDFLDPFDSFRGHEFTADVGFGDKGEVLVQLGQVFIQFGAEFLRFPFAIGHGLQVIDLRFAFDHFKTGADFMDAVIDGFQLGRLVDHVFRRRYLAAIVKQPGDLQFVPFGLIEIEIGVWSVLGLAYGLDQHHGQFRDPLAVSARIGRFGVDGRRDQFDERIK